MKKKIIFFCLALSMQTVFAQTNSIDTTLQKITLEKNDSVRFGLIVKLSSTISGEINPHLSLQVSQRLLIQSQESNDKVGEAMALSVIGSSYRLMGNTINGLKFQFKAKAIAEQTGNFKLLSYIKNQLGNIYKDKVDYSKAISLYLSAEEDAVKAKDEVQRAGIWLNLAAVYLFMNKLDSSLKYSQDAYEKCLQISYKDEMADVFIQLAGVHSKLGNSSLAVTYFDLAIKECFIVNNPRYFCWAYTGLAQHYHDVNQNDSSVMYARKAIAAVKNTDFNNESIKPAKLLLDIYENSNSDSAIKYFKIYKAANDSLFSTKTIQQEQLLTIEEEQRQQELAAEKIKTEQQRKQNIQYSLIGLGIISFVILFLALSRRHITNTKLIRFLGVIALLVVFEFLNLLLHPFLERITNHYPVLMLLALVCIAALLVPLHHKLEKWATQKLVEKNKQIRLANAKKTIKELDTNTGNL